MKRLAAFLLMMACMTAGALAEKRVTLTFAGDVTLGSEERLWTEESSLVRCQAREGDAYFLECVRPLFAQDDVTVVNLEGVLSEFDAVIGLDRVKAAHINDSLNPVGARKDRHALIGEGTLGTEAIVAFMTHEKLRHIPFELETPTDDAGHGAEIAMLRGSVGTV